MKVYTFFSDTHKAFIDSYVSSFPFELDFDLEMKYFPQECETGKYHSENWNKTMKRKVEYILYSLEKTKENELFVHSDIDIQFFGKIKNDLILQMNDFDIRFQNDGHQLSMGFFVCRKNTKTQKLFNKVLSDLKNYRDDQFAVNGIIKTMNLSYSPLPEHYYTVGLKHGVWQGNDILFNIPKNILVHHANFTEGIDNKLKLIQLIKKQVNNFK
jgi:hypothetical protein